MSGGSVRRLNPLYRASLATIVVVVAVIGGAYVFGDPAPAVRIALEFLAGALTVLLTLIELLALRKSDVVGVIAAFSGLITIVLCGVLLHETSNSSLPFFQVVSGLPSWLRWGAVLAPLILVVAVGIKLWAGRSERRMRKRTGQWPRQFPGDRG